MRNLKNVLICWKKGLQKILAFATIVLVGLLLTACCSQKEIVQPTVQVIPTHKIDTCFNVKSDTILFFETDTLRVEAYIDDTNFRLKVETKPIIVRDTITTKIEQEKAKKEEEKAKKKEEKAKKKDIETKKNLSLFFSIAGIIILSCGGYWKNKK